MTYAFLVAVACGTISAIWSLIFSDTDSEFPDRVLPGERGVQALFELLTGLRFTMLPAAALWLSGQTDAYHLIVIGLCAPVFYELGRRMRATLPNSMPFHAAHIGAWFFGAFYGLAIGIVAV